MTDVATIEPEGPPPVRRRPLVENAVMAVLLASYVGTVGFLLHWMFDPIDAGDGWEPDPNEVHAAAPASALDPRWVEVNKLPRTDDPEPALSPEDR